MNLLYILYGILVVFFVCGFVFQFKRRGFYESLFAGACFTVLAFGVIIGCALLYKAVPIFDPIGFIAGIGFLHGSFWLWSERDYYLKVALYEKIIYGLLCAITGLFGLTLIVKGVPTLDPIRLGIGAMSFVGSLYLWPEWIFYRK